MTRIGIDVGGTNTDAVLVDNDTVIGSVKTSTTEDVTTGVQKALKTLVKEVGSRARSPEAVMIGTTHFVNAVVQRRDLNRVAAIRICLPASASLPPFIDWPEDLAEIVNGGFFLVEGGHEYDGQKLVPMDERAVATAARKIRADGVASIAISAVFSPLISDCEDRACEIVMNEHPDAHITKSSVLGRIGLLERENAALLNSALIKLARETTIAFSDAIAECRINAPLFITQNDGTVATASAARDFPVYSFASGPTNSMRGAAFLSKIENAIVCDVGGTTSDVGALTNGYPRQANNVVEIGGVRTLFRMPDLLTIGIGGGTQVANDPLTLGPISVGYHLLEKALVFGGDTLTCTDIAVAAGLADIGERAKVSHLNASFVDRVINKIHTQLFETVDRMKTDAGKIPLLAVGGGAILVPERMTGVSEVVKVRHHGVANAVGAAIAQISGEVDQIFHEMSREDVLAAATKIAKDNAINAGASADSLSVIDVEDLPLAYLPGHAIRARVRVVGDIAV